MMQIIEGRDHSYFVFVNIISIEIRYFYYYSRFMLYAIAIFYGQLILLILFQQTFFDHQSYISSVIFVIS